MEEVTFAKLGISGAMLWVAWQIVRTLWSSGEIKDKSTTLEREALMKERDALLHEREALRLAHAEAMSATSAAHEQELARVRLECTQQIAETHQQSVLRMERLLVDVIKFTASLERMLAKLSEHLQRAE